MFPHLIAGPIVRYADIEDQLRRLEPRLTAALAGPGLFFFATGLVKKVVVADSLAPHVDRLFRAHASLGFVSGWAAGLGYAFPVLWGEDCTKVWELRRAGQGLANIVPGDAKPLQVFAEVLRSEFTGTMARYGIRFIGLTTDLREQIEQYVQRLRSRELI